jgi:tetratricopeptide (TPR) repeat protein
MSSSAETPLAQQLVAREFELARLDDALNKVLDGQSQICLVNGSAGSGKTALIAEFLRQTQQQHENVLITTGDCDAYMGSSDPYLPFREALTVLTGDVENARASNPFGGENRKRLKGLLSVSCQVLVETGPDLVGTFVPTAKIWLGLGSTALQKMDWYERLKKLADDSTAKKLLGTSVQQTQIFEQYANVLRELAKKAPIVIALDDFHWADTDSVSLLFRLCRRIEGSPILIIGAYRPEELVTQYDGQRHPLEKAVVEIKRYFGDVAIDLDQSIETDGARFIHAFLALQPHKLGRTFEKKLHAHTGGHPLFTTELLQTLRERGDIHLDAEGQWVAAETMDWASLPARIEGALAERLGRIDDELRHALELASVQGEQFSAEIVAQLLGSDVRKLVRHLGGDLQEKHKLVESVGVERIGSQRISTYRFSHKLIRTYLYNELDNVERVYLHEDVGIALEMLYGDSAEKIAAKLAGHFEVADLPEKAIKYMCLAGDQAVAAVSLDVAIEFYSRALNMMSAEAIEQRLQLIVKRERIYDRLGVRQKQKVDLTEMDALALRIGDPGKRAYVTLRHAWLANHTGDNQNAERLARSVIDLLDSPDLVHGEDGAVLTDARICLGEALYRQGRNDEAALATEQALIWAQRGSDQAREARALEQLGLFAGQSREFDRALELLERSLAIAQEMGDRRRRSTTLAIIGMVYMYLGRFSDALTQLGSALMDVTIIGDLRRQAAIMTNIAEALTLIGRYEQATQIAEHALQVCYNIGERQNEEILLGNLAEVAYHQGDLDLALTYTEAALEVANELNDAYGVAYLQGTLGLVRLRLGQTTEAEAAFTLALAAWETYDDPREGLRERAGLAELLLNKGGAANVSAASEQARRITDYLAESPEWSGGQATLSLGILLSAYRVLQASSDPDAELLLEQMYALLQQRAKNVISDDARRSYLDIPTHIEIVRIYEQEAGD